MKIIPAGDIRGKRAILNLLIFIHFYFYIIELRTNNRLFDNNGTKYILNTPFGPRTAHSVWHAAGTN